MKKYCCFFLFLSLLHIITWGQVTPILGTSTTTVYISPTGSDSNNGTLNAPLATFQEALFYCPYGNNGTTTYSEIVFLPGTYTITEELRQPCWQYQNGTGYKSVSIRGTHRDSVILDGSTANYTSGIFINLLGNGISIRDLTIQLASAVDTSSHYAAIDFSSYFGICSSIPRSNMLIENILIDGTWDHGININETDSVLVNQVEVRNTNLINLNGRNEPSLGGTSWGSGIKTRLSNDIEIRNARVFHCWGEGIATSRSTNTYVHHNEISDNYSVNIYLDNVIDGVYTNNLTYGSIDDSTYWRTLSPAPGFGVATEYYADNDFALNQNIKIYNNIILNTQGVYFDDNRHSGEPLGAQFEDIWFCNNSIVGWQGDTLSNLRAIRIDYAGYNNGDWSIDSIYLFNNLVGLDAEFVSSPSMGQVISGTPQPLPSSLFYGYNYWGANPEKFSFYNYSHDPITDSINTSIPTQCLPSQLTDIEPNSANYLVYQGMPFSFIQDDFYNHDRMGNTQIGALLPSTVSSPVDVLLNSDCLELFPNPTDGLFEIHGLLGEYTIQILDSSGEVYQTISAYGSSLHIDINALPAGLYFVSIVNNSNNNICVEKILKLN